MLDLFTVMMVIGSWCISLLAFTFPFKIILVFMFLRKIAWTVDKVASIPLLSFHRIFSSSHNLISLEMILKNLMQYIDWYERCRLIETLIAKEPRKWEQITLPQVIRMYLNCTITPRKKYILQQHEIVSEWTVGNTVKLKVK